MSAPSTLPSVPAKHVDFIPYLSSHPTKSLPELLEPYKQYDAKLREVFAQEPNHPALNDPYINVVPVFDGHAKHVKIKARDLENESVEEKEKYVMPLDVAERREKGSPAIVQDVKEFQRNFALFSESSLVDLDWSNIVAAGSAVVTCLLPVPPKHNKSKKTLRQYYHDIIAPASDVDLFIYGLNEEEAVQKIIQIEQSIKDSILTETTTIRTKNAITIASQYPTRHVQIVLRLYKSVSEILTGFDVDCSCAAYDGTQVWTSPRAITAYMTQTNTIDLTRRSPSYENRLSKYSHRGFEAYVDFLERKKIDPTIYERNFARTVGLARLLVLERLPTKSEREAYMDERRKERGRPAINRYPDFSNGRNIKDEHEDEVAEWVDAEDVSDYHTFTIPYGAQFSAKKIEKLLFTKDLLLNAEWNKRDDREVNLHRHPAFFGHAEDVIKDCCGFCPKPVTPEEHDIAEEEAKIYVSGEISFIKDDAGRQAIGSFHPITDDDWTEMAYIGNTTRLCQAIIDEDLEHVEDWLKQEGSDPNCRDHTGRTPLHLAVTSSSAEVVEALIDHGARLVARLADGRTALHLASARGNVEMVRMIMQRSVENEAEEDKKEDIRKKARAAAREEKRETADVREGKPQFDTEDSDIEMVDKEDSDDDMQSTTTGSYMKVKEPEAKENQNLPEDDGDEPDVYDVNVLTWDSKCSPLHYAILNGHIDVVKTLVQDHGADPLLPIKLLSSHDKSPRGAILTLVLALQLPLEKAKAMTQALLEIGASSAQANTSQTTALHFISGEQPEVIETLFQFDEPAAKRAINHLAVSGSSWSPSAESPLMSAISSRNSMAALKLLEAGANPAINFKAWLKSVETQFEDVAQRDSKQNHDQFVKDVEQPIVLAIQTELPDIALQLLAKGADPNTLPKGTQQGVLEDWYRRYNKMESLLEMVQAKLQILRNYKDDQPPTMPKLQLIENKDYLDGLTPGSYKHFVAEIQLEKARASDKYTNESYEVNLKTYNERVGIMEKKQAVEALTKRFEEVEKELIARGAKTFKELYPNLVEEKRNEETPHHYANFPELPWEVTYDFRVHDLVDDTRQAYLQLFQAAWDGDLDTIKSLTLAAWGPENDKTPLKVAITDGIDESPFTLAVLRGHFEIARGIVEIAYTQYDPNEMKEKEKARYRLGNVRDEQSNDDEDEDEDEASDASDSSAVPVRKEMVDELFTINIGEVTTSAKSKISPLTFLEWSSSSLWNYVKFCGDDKKFTYGLDNQEVGQRGYGISLLSWAIITNYMPLFSLMLDLQVEWIDRLAKDAKSKEIPAGFPTFSQNEFGLAIQYGRLDMLAEMIKHGGAGLELESLVKKSGVKYQEKTEFYQGLSVHGKKMAKWISAARGTSERYVRNTHPPLLQAAFKGNLASVEFFMGDAPTRHYRDFAEAYKHDKLITHLNEAAGGFDKTLLKWLGARRDLALHCAVMAEPKLETLKLISYLLERMPNSLELKSLRGHTPLALAFSLGRIEVIKLLIAAGADQTVRDSDGANILHLILVPAYNSSSPDEVTLKKCLALIDKRLVGSLLSERSSHEPGSLTPLARWLKNNDTNEKALTVLCEFGKDTGNEHLQLLDGSGDTPLHYAVKSNNWDCAQVILKYRPDLLYRENSVGRTPYELVEDAFTASCVGNEPSVSGNASYLTTSQSPRSFTEEGKDSYQSSRVNRVEHMWTFIRDFAKQNPDAGKRRLVSLLDANEVAKRLAGRHTQRRILSIGEDEESDVESDAGDSDEYMDEVSMWYNAAPGNPKEQMV